MGAVSGEKGRHEEREGGALSCAAISICALATCVNVVRDVLTVHMAVPGVGTVEERRRDAGRIQREGASDARAGAAAEERKGGQAGPGSGLNETGASGLGPECQEVVARPTQAAMTVRGHMPWS
eukprot:29828-Rhodomonas_salina.2